ncbi:PREDICTED: uncharacterized protein LOC106817122 [Priapulus caudatus]|uniref:Uncharacterized protein LOC106817122 n=1 Tax=Priapulus caudatus TaxID=37621 RepID=A0ABM1EYI5_PRICU|nr:PREDICTED: uncharacterized protein LOC106817122 [Priapulus caudatus]
MDDRPFLSGNEELGAREDYEQQMLQYLNAVDNEQLGAREDYEQEMLQYLNVVDNGVSGEYEQEILQHLGDVDNGQSGSKGQEMPQELVGTDNGMEDRAQKKTKWQRHKEIAATNYKNYRAKMFMASLEKKAIFSGQYNLCGFCQEMEGVILCDQCTSCALMCPACDSVQHAMRPCHDRRLVTGRKEGGQKQCLLPGDLVQVEPGKETTFSVISTLKVLPISQPKECQCGDRNWQIRPGKAVAVNTERGRFDLNLPEYTCTACGLDKLVEADDCIHSGYWPGDPRNLTVLYDMTALESWDRLNRTAPMLATSSYLTILRALSEENSRNLYISGDGFNMAYREWSFCRDKLLSVTQGTSLECPACTPHQHAAHIDGNHKLYRFKSVPRGSEESYFHDTFIDRDTLVDSFVEKVRSGDKATQQSNCGKGHFKAAKTTAPKRTMLDETGLVVATCRHVIMQKAVNMHRGEIYAYPLYLQENFCKPQDVNFVCQDVICRYWPWLAKCASRFPEFFPLLTEMKPFLSVMHAKAHTWSCQVCLFT